jgi:DNA-binding response OmpR family regulator
MRNVRILLDIKDNWLKENISEYLELEGHALYGPTGQVAERQSVPGHSPELVIYDLINFKDKPTEAFQQYQESVPFIFLCESDRYEPEPCNCGCYLGLPFTFDELSERISTVFKPGNLGAKGI